MECGAAVRDGHGPHKMIVTRVAKVSVEIFISTVVNASRQKNGQVDGRTWFLMCRATSLGTRGRCIVPQSDCKSPKNSQLLYKERRPNSAL